MERNINVVNTAESKPIIESLCPGVDKQFIQDFLDRMDDDYFARFSPNEISNHIQMSVGLEPKQPVEVRVTRRHGGEFDISIVGFDYRSEFSIFCGLLSAFGLDIDSGDIYTFAKGADGSQQRTAMRHPGRPPRRSARKVVDVFSVHVKAGESFGPEKQHEFREELQTLAHLLATGAQDQARERLNRFLVERIERMDEPLSGLASPVEIHFDNRTSPEWTVMDAQSDNAFAFLYAVSNALAMRGIYIYKVKIRGDGQRARDRFFISDSFGRKIEDHREQDRLRMAVAMIKQFTRFLPEAPDPAKALRHFDQFMDRVADEKFPDDVLHFLASSEGMGLLAHLLGSSDFLWDDFLGIHFHDFLPILMDLGKTKLEAGESIKESLHERLRTDLARAATFEEKKHSLNQFKDRELFLIDAKHLLDPQVTLMDFSRSLTDLAEVVIDEAARTCYEELHGDHGPFTICGLGKFGGREMGYASDLELLFVHEKPDATPFFESLARRVTEFVTSRSNGVFRIDLRLRPYGDAGAWSIPFHQLVSYYSADGQVEPFERQALIKLRWVAADKDLGRRVEAHRDDFTYSSAVWNREDALHLRRRQMHELVKRGRINVKYSAGGIIDIEYAVQYLQLLHGRKHVELRLPNTLDALNELHRLQIVSETEYTVWRTGYLVLRKLIDALRIVRGDASDLVLPDQTSDEFKSLARRLGYQQKDRSEAARLLSADIHQWMGEVHSQFAERFG
jgi:glutamate-ammonia-ligase adenylyltransferase